MRCFLSLIGFIGFVFVLHANQQRAASKVYDEAKEISYFISTSNPPLSAIENSESNFPGFNYNYSTHLPKRFGIYFIAANLFSLGSVKIPPNNKYSFFVKCNSHFLLNHFSQTLFGVFRF